MNESTSGVSLFSGFIFDLLACYEQNKTTFAKGLFDMAPALDPANPAKPVPIDVYNDMCRWIEEHLGPASLRRAGAAIGSRAYDHMVATSFLEADPSPLEIMQGLRKAASEMIHDPHDRQWEILSAQDGRIVMRRTQTYNCILQEGLLKSLVARTGVSGTDAVHIACVRDGAEFCDYAVTWLK